jgi:hypothetical protein
VGVEVMGLGAWCDILTEDEYRDELAGSAWPPEEVEQSLETFREVLHFRVDEFATLSDGRRLTLADRGWSSRVSGGLAAEDQWSYMAVEQVEADVRNVVLPDDAEETGDEHPWAWLAARLGALGVETTPDELRRLPYDVILTRRLRARLSATE